MSSGALLLRQLQARQARKRQQEAEAKHKRDVSVRSSCGDVADNTSVGPSVDSTGAVVVSTSPCDPTTTSCIDIEVCLGPDCSGGGGGAALLEIEDLVSKIIVTENTVEETGKMQRIRVIDGGCRDHCTMGPNVYVRGGIATDHGTDGHFTKVNDPAACRKVIRAAIDATGITMKRNDVIKCSSSGAERILLLREDGRRWRTLRDRAATERRLRVKERAPS